MPYHKTIPYSLFPLLFGLLSGCSSGLKQEAVSQKEPLNVILMIGDGMGLAQVSTTFYFKDGPSNFSRFEDIGFSITSSKSHKVTDSAGGATAMSTGHKSYNRAIGVTTDSTALPTILEQLGGRGYLTGLISLTSITHATPAAFYAHVTDRDMEEDIAAQLVEAPVDFFAGGGLKFFNRRSDGQDLYGKLERQGVRMDSTGLTGPLLPGHRHGFLLAEEGLPSKLAGRGDFLKEATDLVLDQFSKSESGFFLMIEGSYIDWGGHDRNPELMVSEALDFDQVLGVALDYVESHRNTILIVTADHETGGASVGKAYHTDASSGRKTEIPDSVAVYFNTNQHTAELIPVFSKGVGSDKFRGTYQNNEIYNRLMDLLD